MSKRVHSLFVAFSLMSNFTSNYTVARDPRVLLLYVISSSFLFVVNPRDSDPAPFHPRASVKQRHSK